MQIRQLLIDCRKEQAELNSLINKREYIYSTLLPKAVKIKEVDVQISAPQDVMADTMAEIEQYDSAISRKILTLSRKHRKGIDMIGKLNDTVQRNALELYYLDSRLLSWEQVALEMGYDVRQIYRIKNAAIDELLKCQ
ncbi:MAG: hypothetical protein PUF49_08490 [Firmicutes bacterium]|nr:hypothetical protein [Bacillota bacterium]